MKERFRLAAATAAACLAGGALLAGAGPATAQAQEQPAQHLAPAATTRSSCGGNVVVTPVKYTYGTASCSVWGSPGLKITYHWTTGDGYAAMQAYGMDAAGTGHWYNCGSGGGSCTVPWGNEIARPRVRGWDAVRAATIYFSIG
ncbi:hypothetical protein HEP84_54150 [Streptomyces sp. RLB1-33]|nr:hypothetical protein [Streptomyces sp. RLB1-33]QIY76459.1 hypothetical protein HEP84_54150 [Streptomyces sp. RLB1-33]